MKPTSPRRALLALAAGLALALSGFAYAAQTTISQPDDSLGQRPIPPTADTTPQNPETWAGFIRKVIANFTDLYNQLGVATNYSNTAITTAGNGTLTAASIKGGVITRSGPTAAFTDTTDTAANIIAALPTGVSAGFSWTIYVKNTVNYPETIAAATGVTLSGQTVIPGLSVGEFLVTYTGAGAVSVQGLEVVPLSTQPQVAINALTTVGAGTITGSSIVGGVITRSGPVAAFTDTTDTAANIISALPNAQVGMSWAFTLKNTTAFTDTLAAGAGVTLSGATVLPPNTVLRALATYTGAGAVSINGLYIADIAGNGMPMVVTALNTVGAGTITAAGIVGGVTDRGGAQVAAFTDTTDTAANIIAATPNAQVGMSWEWTYRNYSSQTATIAGGTGVTITDNTVVPPLSWIRYLVTYTGAGAVSIEATANGPADYMKGTLYTAVSGNTPATLTGAQIAGAADVTVNMTATLGGAGTLNTPTAANWIAAIPNAQVGASYRLRIINSSGGAFAWTVTAGDVNVTLNGTMTIAQNTWRDFYVTVATATTISVQAIGTGTQS